jgi:hypothetical protein
MPEAYANRSLSAYPGRRDDHTLFGYPPGIRRVFSQFVADPKRFTRPIPSILLAAAALAVAGCTATAAGTAAGTSSGGAATPPVTSAEALGAFDSYVAAMAQANKTGDGKLALSVVTGVQRGAIATDIKRASYSHAKPVFDRYVYDTPNLYLPEQGGYPHWFVASAPRTFPGSGKASRSASWVGSAQTPLNGTALLLFEQSGDGSPWQLASTSVLPGGASMPRLARDSAGYIPTVKLSDGSLLARPDAAGALQAAVVDDGPASAAMRAVAAGPLTTGMYKGATSYEMGLQPPKGDLYQWHLEGVNQAKFAFRTADGGALVFYAMYLNTVVAVPAYLNKGYPVNPGPAIRYPRDLSPWLAGNAAPRINLEEQDLMSFAAIDPPAAPAKIQVIAVGGTLNYATGS